nr:hypothetical protein ZK856.3 - Caenorhabditis elegans [Caenorhabditis elegans]
MNSFSANKAYVNFTNKVDPADQFAFLEKELSNAEKCPNRISENCTSIVHIVAHIGPGVFEKTPNFTWFRDEYNERFLDLTVRYANSIGWMIFGHHHTDTFHLIKDSKENNVQLALMAPAVTPWFSDLPGAGANNPTFRVYETDAYSKIQDISTYFINLDDLNKNKSTPFVFEYSFKDAYGITGDINPTTMSALLDKMKNNDTLFKKYIDYNTAFWNPQMPLGVYRGAQLCSMEYSDYPRYYSCLSKYTKSATRSLNIPLFSLFAIIYTELFLFLSFSKWVLHFQLFSDIHTRYKNSTYQHPKKKEKSPKNAILINLKNTLGGEKFTVEDVKQELAPFGIIRAVQICPIDACQAFVVFQNDYERSARQSVSRLLELTSGTMFVNGYMWTICRPVKCNHVARTHEEREVEEPGITTSRGVTVDELSGIFASFIQQNSSVSQTSIFSDSTQSFSSYSLFSRSRTVSSSSSQYAESCDSSATITPFSYYPAQQSTGFLNLPPPYHTLPDTAFFRRTKIIPPPPMRQEIAPVTQQIMNCYINSIRKGDSEIGRQRQLSLCSKMELEYNWTGSL